MFNLARIKAFLPWLATLIGRYKRPLLIVILLLIYTRFYHTLVEKLIIENIAPRLALAPTLKNDILFLIVLLAGAWYGLIYLFNIAKEKGRKLSSFTVLATMLVLYALHRFNILTGASWVFTPFKTTKKLYYSDGIFIWVLFFSLRFSKKLEPEKYKRPAAALIEDDYFNETNQTDYLKRKGYAEYIANMLLLKQTAKSFAIAIKGSWGSGKSVFLEQVKTALKSTITINFNPWLSANDDNTLAEFFKILVARISEYDTSLSKTIAGYSSTLLALDKNFSKGFFASFGILKEKQQGSIESLRDKILSELEKHKGRFKIIVFIDDLDRANAKEILAILQIIRSSFNFPNVFFIVAFDDEHVSERIKHEIQDPEKFIQKIFQLEIALPGFPFVLIENKISELILAGKTAIQQTEIKAALSYMVSTKSFHGVINNIRDAIRFANSFNHLYWKKYGEIDHIDFMLLELIKLKYSTIYNAVSSFLLYNVPYEGLSINEGAVVYEPPKDKAAGNNLLALLFGRADNFDEVKTIRLPDNALRYFSDDLFGKISFAAFSAYQNDSFDAFRDLIMKAHAAKNTDELIELITRIGRYTKPQTLFNLNKGLLLIGNLNKDYKYTQWVQNKLLENAELASNTQPRGLETFISDILAEEGGDNLAESQVLGGLLTAAMTHPVPGLDAEFLRQLLLQNLNGFIKNHNEEFDILVFDIYYRIVQGNEPDGVIINTQASELLKSYVEAHQKGYFTTWLIRPHRQILPGDSQYTDFVLEPFIPQYLGYALFEQLLFAQPSSWAVLKLQDFFIQYKANGFAPINYEQSLIEIVSDTRTMFIGSEDYPDIPGGEPVITTRRLNDSQQYPVLANAQWLAHVTNVTKEEAINGGEYLFEKRFDLTGMPYEIKAVKIHVLVDDYLTVEVNGNHHSKKCEGWVKVSTIDAGKDIVKGPNTIRFHVHNAAFPPDRIEADPNANPYEFIYKIIIGEDVKLDY